MKVGGGREGEGGEEVKLSGKHKYLLHLLHVP